MILFLILGILLGAAAVVFALQNTTVITVTLFTQQVEGSLALVLLMTLLTGVVISLLVVLPEGIKNFFLYRSLRKENANLQELLRKQKELTVFAKTNPPTADELAHIDSGAIRQPESR